MVKLMYRFYKRQLHKRRRLATLKLLSTMASERQMSVIHSGLGTVKLYNLTTGHYVQVNLLKRKADSSVKCPGMDVKLEQIEHKLNQISENTLSEQELKDVLYGTLKLVNECFILAK